LILAEASTPADERLIVSWEQFHRDARTLAELLRPRGPFSTLIAITRGGLVPAAIIACELDLRCIETISIASYVAESVRREARIIKSAAPSVLESGKLLVIDDLADSGDTLRTVRAILPAAHIATLYVKPAGKALADTFVQEVPQTTWIEFPWDRAPPKSNA